MIVEFDECESLIDSLNIISNDDNPGAQVTNIFLVLVSLNAFDVSFQ